MNKKIADLNMKVVEASLNLMAIYDGEPKFKSIEQKLDALHDRKKKHIAATRNLVNALMAEFKKTAPKRKKKKHGRA